MNPMPKYEYYKDSGIDWLGLIPANWSIVPAKRRHRVIKSINKQNQCENVLSLTLRGVVNNNPDSPEGLIPSDYASYQIFEKDDLVFKLIDLENIKTSRVGIVHELGIMSPAYIRMRVNSSHYPKYVYYYFYNLYLNSVYNNLGAGVRSTLGPSDLLEIKVIEPSFDEQVAIANFLDQKLLQIDEAIAIKEKQITLLKERKQIIIQQAVTLGLDPRVPLMDTDLSWAPKIASHWSLLPNRLFIKIRRIPVGLAHKNYQLLSLTKQGILIRDLSTGAGKQSDFLERMQEVRKGDLIFCLFDVEETPRTVGLSWHLGMISADYTIFECIDEHTGRFLEYFYKNIDDQKLLKPLYKGLRNRIPKPKFLRTNCPMPPKKELIKIVNYLDAVEVDTARSIEMILTQIEKLKEYKTTLINSAVTGKIKVA